MELWQPVVLAGIGAVAGWMNVMAGGGSMLTVPTMLFLGLPGPVANGSNRIAIIAQNISAVTSFFRDGHSDFRLSLSLALAALPGAVAGAMLGTRLDGPWFNRVLALIMIAVMLLMLSRKKNRHNNTDSDTVSEPSRQRLVWGHICMVGAGAWGGFIQIGVGFILMPILHRVIGLDLVRVNMHKVFIVLVYSVAALAVFASQVDLSWSMGLALAVGNAIGGWLGARTTVVKGERTVRIVLNSVLVVFILKLLFFS